MLMYGNIYNIAFLLTLVHNTNSHDTFQGLSNLKVLLWCVWERKSRFKCKFLMVIYNLQRPCSFVFDGLDMDIL